MRKTILFLVTGLLIAALIFAAGCTATQPAATTPTPAATATQAAVQNATPAASDVFKLNLDPTKTAEAQDFFGIGTITITMYKDFALYEIIINEEKEAPLVIAEVIFQQGSHGIKSLDDWKVKSAPTMQELKQFIEKKYPMNGNDANSYKWGAASVRAMTPNEDYFAKWVPSESDEVEYDVYNLLSETEPYPEKLDVNVKPFLISPVGKYGAGFLYNYKTFTVRESIIVDGNGCMTVYITQYIDDDVDNILSLDAWEQFTVPKMKELREYAEKKYPVSKRYVIKELSIIEISNGVAYGARGTPAETDFVKYFTLKA